MDLSTLTLAQLRSLEKKIPAEIKKRETQEKSAVLNELKAFAQDRGFTLEQLLDKEIKPGKVKGVVKVKYRHPQNGDLAWTGRGRTPRWVLDWQAGGGSLEALLV